MPQTKKKTIVLLLMLLAATVDGQLYFEEGGSVDMISYRNPFYRGVGFNPVPCPSIGINIWSPVNGTTYLVNNILLNVTTTNALSCWYRIDNNAWNPISCQYNDTRTFAEGEQTLTVLAMNGACFEMESVVFTMAYPAEGGYISEYPMVLIAMFSSLMLFMFSGRRRKRRRSIR